MPFLHILYCCNKDIWNSRAFVKIWKVLKSNGKSSLFSFVHIYYGGIFTMAKKVQHFSTFPANSDPGPSSFCLLILSCNISKCKPHDLELPIPLNYMWVGATVFLRKRRQTPRLEHFEHEFPNLLVNLFCGQWKLSFYILISSFLWMMNCFTNYVRKLLFSSLYYIETQGKNMTNESAHY